MGDSVTIETSTGEEIEMESEEAAIIEALRSDDESDLGAIHDAWGDRGAEVIIDRAQETLDALHRVHADQTSLTIEEADGRAFEIIRNGVKEFDDHLLLWTGGKDSTAMMHYLREHQYVDFEEFDVLFVDHEMHFDEVVDFVEDINHQWLGDGQLTVARNEPFFEYINEDDDVLDDDGEPRQHVATAALPEAQQEEIEWAAEEEGKEVPEKIPWSTDSFWGNHVLKTIPLKETIEDGGYDAVWVGIRKDEGESRAGSDAIESRDNPSHHRVHPMVEFTLPQLWAYTKREFVPYCKLYDPEFGGYDSLGAEPFTNPTPNVQPLLAAEQGERAGRAQNKEDDNVMKALRNLGYM